MSEAIAAPAPQLRVDYLRVDGIRPDPQNPRKTFREIEQLAESLKARGIQIPLTVRPVIATEDDPANFMLVFGERRWRAARVAGLAEVPALVREMSDAEALELMLVELAQTSDVHPVEEAHAYLRLHTMKRNPDDPNEQPLSVEEIAARVDKSVSHVYGRMKLASLDEAVRRQALEGDLPATLALAIARLDPKVQAEAMAAVKLPFAPYNWRPYREAVGILHDQFMLNLKEAPWDLKDEHLVESAGSCTKCPKRSGNQPELFGGERIAKDTCLDPKCFVGKKSAFVALRIKTAQDAGKSVLSVVEAKKIIGKHGQLKSDEFLDLDAYMPGEGKTYREKLGKKAPEPTLAPTAEGIRELVRREDVAQVLGKQKIGQQEAADRAEREERQREFDEGQRRRGAIADMTMGAVVQKLEEVSQFSKGLWFVIATAVLGDFCDYQPLPEQMVVRRLGHPPRTSDQDLDLDELTKLTPSMSAEQLCALVVELLLMHGDEYHKLHRGEEGAIDELARMLSVDKKKFAKQFKDADKAEKKAAEKKAAEVVYAIKKLAPAKKPKIIKKAAPKAAKKKAKKK